MHVKIVVTTHKSYWMPSDPIYFPLQVGQTDNSETGFQSDSEGTNISLKNPFYCELTGLFWAWKNIKADYIGLVHYRRHFSNGCWAKSRRERVISGAQIKRALCEKDILLPKPRNYFIETTYSHYAHAHNIKDLDLTREIISELHPACLPAFDRSMKRTKGHRFNMFVMKYEPFCRYCEWLFSILFELENRIDISNYDAYNLRVFGFVGERLLDTWIETEQLPYHELPIVNLEDQHWIKKGFSFLMRKCGLRSKHGTIGYLPKKPSRQPL